MANVTQTTPERRGPSRWLIIGLVVLALIVVLLILNAGALFNAGDSVLRFAFEPNQRVQGEVVLCSTNTACSITHAVIYGLIFILVIITGFAYTTLLERRFLAMLQHRVGPNRVGPLGLLQPAADAVKLITKEDIMPAGAYRAVYLIAPMLKAVPTLIVLAVVPLGPDILVPWFDGRWYQVPLGLADPNVGVLYLLAVTSIGTYGVVLAGWASNNKYAMLGGMRATAQMISYELSLGLTMAVPIIIAGSMSLGDIINNQTYLWQWYVFQNPLAFGILFIALLAEINRSPFDLPEAEQELTAGYMTEYSGMKFGLIMMAEYVGMIGIAAIVSALYLGGYNDGFGLVNSIPILGPLVFIGKIILLLVVMVWIRGTLPRIRYDRLMSFGWKVMLPLALLAVAWTAIAVVIAEVFDSVIAYGITAAVFVGLVVIGLAVMAWRQRGQAGDDDEADAFYDDPVITGERRGLGQMIVLVIGGILAVPFALYNFTLRVLDNLSGLADDKQDSAGSTSIEPTDKTDR